MFGSALTFLAMVFLEQKATVLRALFLGFSVAIADFGQIYRSSSLLFPALVVILRSGGKEYRVNKSHGIRPWIVVCYTRR